MEVYSILQNATDQGYENMNTTQISPVYSIQLQMYSLASEIHVHQIHVAVFTK